MTTTTDTRTVADALRALARDMIEHYPNGLSREEAIAVASELQAEAHRVAALERTLDRRLTADHIPVCRSRPKPWQLGGAPAPAPAPAQPKATPEATGKVIGWRPRGHTLPVSIPVDGGVA